MKSAAIFAAARIRRNELVHEPTVRRPAHPRRLVGVLVIRPLAAQPQAQLASAPEASVTLVQSPPSGQADIL